MRSALAGPAEGFGGVELYPTLHAKGAALAYRVAKGHACFDGNKRLAVILTSAFLEANDSDMDASADEVEHIFRHVADSDAADRERMMADLEGWFEQVITPLIEED